MHSVFISDATGCMVLQIMRQENGTVTGLAKC